MFSIVVFFGFHWDSIGFAAARIDVRAFSWQIIPACQKETNAFLNTAATMYHQNFLSNFRRSPELLNGFCSTRRDCKSLRVKEEKSI